MLKYRQEGTPRRRDLAHTAPAYGTIGCQCTLTKPTTHQELGQRERKWLLQLGQKKDARPSNLPPLLLQPVKVNVGLFAFSTCADFSARIIQTHIPRHLTLIRYLLHAESMEIAYSCSFWERLYVTRNKTRKHFSTVISLCDRCVGRTNEAVPPSGELEKQF